jgi:2-succinyl-6-hydroxy-2,4-cyclohexadiene-1-carboxylate synthase
MNAPLVLLHGMLGGPHSFDALGGVFNDRLVHAPTLFGHGPAPRAVPDTFEDATDRLAEELDPLGGPVDVLGYSFGARLALGLCARHPGHVRRALLLSVHPGLRSEPERAERRAQDEALAIRLEREGIAAFVDHWERLPLFASQDGLPSQLVAAQRAVRLAHRPTAIAAAFRRLGLAEMPDLRDTIAALRDRARLVVGAIDDKFVALNLQLTRSIPGLAVEIVPGCGHSLILEAPARVARIAAAFFAPFPIAETTQPSMEHPA